jgi:hypothetical protein
MAQRIASAKGPRPGEVAEVGEEHGRGIELGHLAFERESGRARLTF